jgi:signal transduction histidine kinase
MEAAFVSEVTSEAQHYRAAVGDNETFTIVEGASTPRRDGYCQHVLERDRPWVVRDAARDVVAAALPITTDGDIGAYLGVPVHHPDGRPFGTLCCISHDPRPELGDREVVTLETLAEVLGFHLAQLEQHEDRVAALEAEGAELTGRVRQDELRLGVFSEIVGASETPVLVLDPDRLRIDYVNEAGLAWLGHPTEGVVDTPLWRHTPELSATALRERLTDVAAGHVTKQRVEGLDPGGDHEVVVQRIVPPQHGPVLLLLAHDVTERRHSERRLARALELERSAAADLRELDGLRNAFLSAVSHELRTPLTSIRLAATTLANRRMAAERVPELLERLRTSAERLDRLLADLLDLNQFAHGRLELAREPVRLDHLVRDAAGQVELGSSHRLELDLAPLEAHVGPIKYERIVVNLVRNAVTHTAGGVVRVRLTRTDDGALLVVEDEGEGIEPSDRERLFQPFQQGATVPSHRPGTGIGLALVATFARLHGGSAWVADSPRGAAFHVLVPLEDPGPAGPGRGPHGTHGGHGGHGGPGGARTRA